MAADVGIDTFRVVYQPADPFMGEAWQPDQRPPYVRPRPELFFDMLFALNNQLVADMKWRYYCAERLAQLPPHFEERIKNPMLLQAFSVEELERRQGAFMEMWWDMVPIIEQEVDMPYAEFSQLT
jgi:hypothetical protein